MTYCIYYIHIDLTNTLRIDCKFTLTNDYFKNLNYTPGKRNEDEFL